MDAFTKCWIATIAATNYTAKKPDVPESILLDPNFWRSFGVALRLEQISTGTPPPWLLLWYSFIDHLALDRDLEAFFIELEPSLSH